jgi:hypothetical protein
VVFASGDSLSSTLARCLLAWCLIAGHSSLAQTLFPNQEVRIHNLPSLTAKSNDATDVLAASVAIILKDREICCGKTSALGYDLHAANTASLADIASKLQGRHVMSDGRAAMVTAEYMPLPSVNSGSLIGAIREKQALLMQWNSQFYVIYGVIYNKTVDNESGARMNAIHKLLLLDPRYSDERREVVFDRLTDDMSKVQGVLVLRATRQ